jgi:hypothetical protein
VELSREAQALFGAKHAERLKAIQEKIESGFYFSGDVTSTVADRILQELSHPGKK